MAQSFVNIIYLKIAGFTIKLDFYPRRKKSDQNPSFNKLFETIQTLFSGYITNSNPHVDYTIELHRKHPIILTKQVEGKSFKFIHLCQDDKDKTITFQHISISHFLILVKKIIHTLLVKNGGFIMHGSAVHFNGKALVFVGRSGAGKSTAMSLLSDKYLALADDSVIIKKQKDIFFLYQTPFFVEKNKWIMRNKEGFEINSVFFLRKSQSFKKEKIFNKKNVALLLTRQMFTDKKDVKSQMKYLLEFVAQFNRFYFLYFAKDSQQLANLLTATVTT